MTFQYTPDEDIKVHEEGAIRLICRAFQSHESGLPEWIKNASDEYAGRDAPPDQRVIVIIFDSGRGSAHPSISVLDFSGMSAKVIEEQFRYWADPEASQRGRRSKGPIQGGHGNGGKCYMTMMFEEHALLHTVKDGKACRYGVRAGSVQFGYIPDRERGRDSAVDAREELTAALAGVGVDFSALPEEARVAFGATHGFTLVTGRKPKGLNGRLPVLHLIEQLMDHPQMIVTLDFAKVFVMSNGTVVPRANPIVLQPVTPDPAFAIERVIPIPEDLVDPTSDLPVSTTDEGRLPPGKLVLRTSDVSMRWGRRGRHTVVYRAQSGFIGFRPVLEFDVQSPFRDRIYGECELLALEPTKQNQRAALAETPITRAVEAFIGVQIQEYAHEFEARDRRKYDQQERDELSRINEALDRWKNQFMSKYLEGMWGPGTKGPPPPPPPLPAGIPKRVEVSLSHPYSGIGVSFKPTIKFFDKDDRRIRPVPFNWMSADTNIAYVDDALNVVTTYASGSTEIWAETLDGRLESNRVPLNAVRIREVRLEPETLEVPLGSRRRIQANCQLSSGEVLSDIYLVWMESEPTIAQVSAAGHVFGHSLGTTEVLAGDDKCMADKAVQVAVVDATDGSGEGDKPGKGFPRILISGIDDDPEAGETVNFSSDDPPVWQRPQDVDRNIWWINSSAPFARMYLDQSRGYGYKNREWRIYHLERFTDIMVQIALVSDPENENLDINGWLLKWGERMAEIQAAAARALGSFIDSGELPTGP